MASDPEMASYIGSMEEIAPLEPRECLFGGRTNALVLFKEAAEDETIEYADYVSLYPTVLKVNVSGNSGILFTILVLPKFLKC
jgi:hypothetical protein